MMPINNFNHTKIKIYSTSKGIKIVDSPIKIQILNLLEGKVSEADIVKETGKSKSTISVHLKNLIDEGIISFKSHPLDRRSKLFYIISEYIGEIYPDKIIYKTPEIESTINNKGQLYTEFFRQYKSILLINGLQLEPMELLAGITIGKNIYQSIKTEKYDTFLNNLIEKFDELGLGHLKVSGTQPLILKNNDCQECHDLQYNMPICNIIKGILKGVFDEYFEKTVSVEEVECYSNYDDCCTFLIEVVETTNNF